MAHDGKAQRGGISLTTLIIASAASAAAAYVVSRVWGAGTLLGAATTPVIVALVSEALRRPVERLPPISTVLPGSAGQPTPPGAAPAVSDGPAAPLPGDPVRPRSPGDPDGPPPSFTAPRRTYQTANRRRWRLAIATGLAAFLIVAAIYTITDLASGGTVTGNGRSSSLFDFSNRHRSSTPKTTTTTTTLTQTTTAPTTTTQTVTVPATTPTVTVTTPTTTTTVAPEPSTTPVAPPAPALGADQATTPATTPAAP